MSNSFSNNQNILNVELTFSNSIDLSNKKYKPSMINKTISNNYIFFDPRFNLTFRTIFQHVSFCPCRSHRRHCEVGVPIQHVPHQLLRWRCPLLLSPGLFGALGSARAARRARGIADRRRQTRNLLGSHGYPGRAAAVCLSPTCCAASGLLLFILSF